MQQKKATVWIGLIFHGVLFWQGREDRKHENENIKQSKIQEAVLHVQVIATETMATATMHKANIHKEANMLMLMTLLDLQVIAREAIEFQRQSEELR